MRRECRLRQAPLEGAIGGRRGGLQPVRAVIQRVAHAVVEVEAREVAAIGPGLVILLAVATGDGEGDVAALVDKVAGLRIFGDDEGRLNRSILEVGGSVLVVSQFTLVGDIRRGRRPSFTDAADPDIARRHVDSVVRHFSDLGLTVRSGMFGASMQVTLTNDGPVTFVIDVTDATAR
jgi:D-aminoacyl-tRNA deacylase